MNFFKVFACTIFMLGCSHHDKPRTFDYGHLEQDRYVNLFFGIEITLPNTWLVQVMDERISNESIHKINASKQKPTKPSDEKTKILLSAYQFKLDSVVYYNPHIAIIADDIKDAPPDLSAFDYLLLLKDNLNQSGVKYNHIDSVLTPLIINGIGFYNMDADVKLNGLHIKQSYYAMVKDRCILLVVLNYATDDQKEILLKSLNSLKYSELKK